MNQPIPAVTEKDVERIAIRDFGQTRLFQVMSILGECGKQSWNRSNSPRVRAAILKLANGDLEQLASYTEIAIQDFRDVIAMAEYPRYAAEVVCHKVSPQFQRAVFEDDWKQYREWFKRK